MRSRQMMFFLATVVGVSLLLHIYVAARMLATPRYVSTPTAMLIAVVMALSLVGLMILGHQRHTELATAVGVVWLGVIFQLFVWTFFTEALRVGLAFADVDPLERARIVAITIAMITSLMLVYGLWRALGPVPVRTVDVPLHGLPPELDGLRIAHLTDTHASVFLGPRWMARVAQTVEDQHADIVCHTGDIADGDVARREPTIRQLAAITCPRRFFITGNHEYFADVTHTVRIMESMGWTFLHNKHQVIEHESTSLVIAGIDDRSAKHSGVDGHGADIDAALQGAPADTPVVLLAHQPRQVEDAMRRDVALQMSGHTHGGQIWPFHLLVRAEQKHVAGLAHKGLKTMLYTSRGAGFWGPPFRIWAPPDITVLRLRSGQA